MANICSAHQGYEPGCKACNTPVTTFLSDCFGISEEEAQQRLDEAAFVSEIEKFLNDPSTGTTRTWPVEYGSNLTSCSEVDCWDPVHIRLQESDGPDTMGPAHNDAG